MAQKEDFDTWEPTHDYPSAPPAKSAKVGKTPQRLPAPTQPDQAALNAANFFEEFAASAQEANRVQATPPLPAAQNGGIAALLANAQNILNADGPEAPDRLFATTLPEVESARAELPETTRNSEKNLGIEAGKPEKQTKHTQQPADNKKPGQNGDKHAVTRRGVTQTIPQPIHSEGWKSLVAGWQEHHETSNPDPSNKTETIPGNNEPLKTENILASQIMWQSLHTEQPQPTEKTSKTSGKPARNIHGKPASTKHTQQTADEPKLRVKRVGLTEPETIQRESFSPVALLAAAILLSLIGVGIGIGIGMNIVPRPTVTVTASPTNLTRDPDSPDSVGNATPTPSEGDTAGTAALTGLKIAIDPGHNGGNAAAWQEIGRNVADGRGGQKPCDTTGTATSDGYAEHTFNWKVANLLKSRLETAGATVFLTRDSNVGVGPCVDVRGTFGQKVGADLMISIHGNGTTDTAVHGFFAMISDPPLNNSQGEPSRKLAQHLIGGLQSAGFTPQNSGAIQNGLWKRNDLAGLNLQEVPNVMLELGEMRNPADAALMKSEVGQHKYAQAIFSGLQSWAAENRDASTSSTPPVNPNNTSGSNLTGTTTGH